MEIREPKKKRVGPHIKPQQPFPIYIESERGLPFADELWPLYFGNFSGDSVIVTDPEDMKILYTMGFFGKGSFSRGYPSFGMVKNNIPPIIKERQWQRRKAWIEKIQKHLETSDRPSVKNVTENEIEKEKIAGQSEQEEHMDCENGEVKQYSTESDNLNVDKSECMEEGSHDIQQSTKLQCSSEQTSLATSVLVLADSDEEDLEKVLKNPQPHIEKETYKTAVETLNLSLEEAFFLSYALGCLQVIDLLGQPMSLKQMWQIFQNVKPNFIETYVAYHHFRAKGWVVKSGYKFGGDFLLYKQGPPFYHASYIVIVEKLDSYLVRSTESLTWTKLHGLNRLAENSGKDIVTCQVVFPDTLTTEDMKTPLSLHKFQVNELLTKRWISTQERVEKEDT